MIHPADEKEVDFNQFVLHSISHHFVHTSEDNARYDAKRYISTYLMLFKHNYIHFSAICQRKRGA